MDSKRLQQLRNIAIKNTFFQPTSLNESVRRLGFVQADPIRAPATAQDLILRHRVDSYRTGDLERHYHNLDIEEDLFYAYGFLDRSVWSLLHPREKTTLSKMDKKLLKAVSDAKEIHPRQLEAQFGSERIVNAWGGYSKATTKALEDLHYAGFLRIVRRERGIRIYAPAKPSEVGELSAQERAGRLAKVIVQILQPVPEKTLRETLNRVKHSLNSNVDFSTVLARSYKLGELIKVAVDDVQYVLCGVGSGDVNDVPGDVPEHVRFLAPFDPLVWDRRRFELFWGWAYRFEAYTPVAKRERGYYAMPLMWRDAIIGWVNASLDANKSLIVEPGFIKSKPRDKQFKAAFDLELERFRNFLGGS